MIEIKNNRIKFAIFSGVLLIILSVVFFLLIRDTRYVKGIGKIEALYEMSMSDLASGGTNASPKFYATISGQQYRLMPMMESGVITISKDDYLFEGFVPQFDSDIHYYDQNNDISKEVLAEGYKIYKKICKVKPEYFETENSDNLSRRLVSYLKDENNPSIKILVTINIKPMNN